MYPEYLYNNDTQEITRRVSELAAKDEPALRAHCLEVSRQTDTSSLSLQGDCAAKGNAVGAALTAMANSLRELTQSLSSEVGVFRTRNGQADFPAVCRAVTQIEEERLHLLVCITELTQVRRAIASGVAETNRALHLLSVAGRAVPEDARSHYVEATERTKAAYVRLTELDVTVREVQSFSMTFVERHLPAFMEQLRSVADFNHTGEALDRAAIRTLCKELLILIDRTPNVSF